MPSSYTPLLRLTLPADGELVGTWGQTVNTGITTLEEAAVAGTVAVAMADANQTLTVANGATDQARYNTIRLTGVLTAQRNVICPSSSKNYFVRNATTGGFGINFKTAAGTGIVVPAGTAAVLYCDGTNVLSAVNSFADVTEFNAAEAIRLSASGAAIVWRLNDAEEPPGLVISRNAASQIMILRGRGGVSIEDSTTAVQFFSAMLVPQTDKGVDLGAVAQRWANAYIGGVAVFSGGDSAPIILSGTNAAIVWNKGGPNLAVINYVDTMSQFGLTTTGANGIYFETDRGLRFVTTRFGPDVDRAIDLGTTALRWNNAYIGSIIDYSTLTMQSDTSGAVVWKNADGLQRGYISNDQATGIGYWVGGTALVLANSAATLQFYGTALRGAVTDTISIGEPGNQFAACYAGRFQAYVTPSGGSFGLQVNCEVPNVGGNAPVWRASPAASEPSTYNSGFVATMKSQPGFPIFRYDFSLAQYSGYNGYSCSVHADTGQWAFSVAISNPSSSRLKSNWMYEMGAVVDGLADITEVGSFDFTIGTYPKDFPVAAKRGLPITIRQVGVSAEQLRRVMPDAVSEPNGDGVLNVTYGNAALVAAVALAKRIKAIETLMGI
jgi:hypothetical protein